MTGTLLTVDGGLTETATISKEQLQERVAEALVEFGADRDAIKLDATFESLDVDSLDLVELSQSERAIT